jgi:hypothetical protein
MRTARSIGRTAQQSLFGLRILCNIKELFDIGRDHPAALRA